MSEHPLESALVMMVIVAVCAVAGWYKAYLKTIEQVSPHMSLYAPAYHVPHRRRW